MELLDNIYQSFGDSVDMPYDYREPYREKVKKANDLSVRDLTDAQKNVRLFLTNIRTFQQYATVHEIAKYKNIISTIRLRKRGQQFYVRDKPPRFCRSYRIAFLNFSRGQLQNIQFTNVACKSWTCPACCMSKALSVKYKLRECILRNNLDYFLTLTLDPKKIPKEYLSAHRNRTHKYITKLFNHLLTVLRRKSFTYFNKKSNKFEKYINSEEKEKLKYVWVMEFQKNRNAHLHILLNLKIPIEVIRDVWVQIGGGQIMRVEKVKTLHGISLYLTDYIVKGIKSDNSELSGFKYFERRYSISKSCIKNKPIFCNLDNSPEIKQYLIELRLACIANYIYNPHYTDLTINFTNLNNE